LINPELKHDPATARMDRHLQWSNGFNVRRWRRLGATSKPVTVPLGETTTHESGDYQGDDNGRRENGVVMTGVSPFENGCHNESWKKKDL
jgi:hypothetical protein